MYAKLALAFATAALILAAGGFLAVWSRLDDAPAPAPERAGRPPGVVSGDPKRPNASTQASDWENPLETPDLTVKVNWLIRRIEEMAEDDYDSYTEFSQDLFSIKREVRQLKVTLRQIVEGLGRGPGGTARFGWGLAPADAPLTQELKDTYLTAAAEQGVKVEEGRVTVRGFLNFSPKVNMPIEYFITRYPESNHETLVHLIGDMDLAALEENPYMALKGLATGLYKGMVAAGFRQGAPTHPDPESDPKDPTWVMASGDTVYIAVRYEREGQVHVARATDWIIDPAADAVLPPDCFRFTGGTRGEDPDTGEDILAAEAMGLLVSVWPTYTALVEVALESSLRNDYSYSLTRIPRKEGSEPLYLDVIFSKTPVEPVGDGALPLDKEPAGDTGLVPRGAGDGEGGD